MTAQKLREKYLEYFKSRGHAVIPSASLIPENDPTVLFTTAGMHPLVPYLMGEKHPAGQRLCDVQKCIRTGDIDEVGDGCHLTFFEMLGNWSLGDYFKEEAIKMSFEFLTSEKYLNIPLKMLAFTVFKGENDIPADEEAAEIWKGLGVPESRIARLGKKDNWWGPAGETGPCGPDTEMFYWTGEGEPPEVFDPEDKRWVEIWNDVFMQYNKTKDGRYDPLAQKNIDTGMGLERVLMVLNGKCIVYETELFQPIIKKIEELSGINHKDQKSQKSFRVIADHLRAATFILGDEKGIEPSNVKQGYVLRRLIRRAVFHGRQLGIKDVFAFKLAEAIIDQMREVYPELRKNKDFIIEQLVREEEKFQKTIEKGIEFLKKKYFNRFIGGVNPENLPKGMRIENNMMRADGTEIFHIYETFGLPIEVTQEIMTDWGVAFDEQTIREAEEAFKKHRELSRTASAGMFKGGLADASEETKKLHTAAHLMLAALRQVLGEHVFQKGSNITAERLRFDFSHPEKMTPEQIRQVEDLVNEQIKKNLPVVMEEMSLEEAKERGAMGVFESKYGEKVKVYSIGDPARARQAFSKEICGGPHARNTGEIGSFKIVKEEASGAGVRRIKAVIKDMR